MRLTYVYGIWWKNLIVNCITKNEILTYFNMLANPEVYDSQIFAVHTILGIDKCEITETLNGKFVLQVTLYYLYYSLTDSLTDKLTTLPEIERTCLK